MALGHRPRQERDKEGEQWASADQKHLNTVYGHGEICCETIMVVFALF